MTDPLQKTVYVAIGPPGCGKSTWWLHSITNGLIPADRSVRINMDDIREDLTGNAEDQTQNALVAKVAHQNLLNALANRIDLIYWDNTSARPKYRKAVIKPAKEAGYKVVGIYFNLPEDIVKSRNAGRDRKVPEDVIDRFIASLNQNPPTVDEGFDDIITIYVDENGVK